MNGVEGAVVTGAVHRGRDDDDAVHVERAKYSAQLFDRCRWRRVRSVRGKRELARVAEHVDMAVASACRHPEVDRCGMRLGVGVQRRHDSPLHGDRASSCQCEHRVPPRHHHMFPRIIRFQTR